MYEGSQDKLPEEYTLSNSPFFFFNFKALSVFSFRTYIISFPYLY